MNNTEKQVREAAIRQLTAIRAYEMWENQGRPHGRDQMHWRQAEQEVMQCLGAMPGTADAAPVVAAKAVWRKRVPA